MFEKDEWMSEFYGTEWYHIKNSIKSEDLKNPYSSYFSKGMYEWRISVSNYLELSEAQRLGFEIVETMIEFVSEIKPKEIECKNIRIPKKEDIEDILNITIQCYTENENFYNRFKNKKYFSEEQQKEYFLSSIKNSFYDKNTINAVYLDGEKIVGYYMLKKIGENVYKGIMTALLPDYRGKNKHIDMQKFCFNKIKNNFKVINTTQLNNMFTINNHIKEGRKLNKITHILYKLNK